MIIFLPFGKIIFQPGKGRVTPVVRHQILCAKFCEPEGPQRRTCVQRTPATMTLPETKTTSLSPASPPHLQGAGIPYLSPAARASYCTSPPGPRGHQRRKRLCAAHQDTGGRCHHAQRGAQHMQHSVHVSGNHPERRGNRRSHRTSGLNRRVPNTQQSCSTRFSRRVPLRSSSRLTAACWPGRRC